MGLMSRLMPQHRGYCCYRVRMTHILVLILVVSAFIYWSSLRKYTTHKAIQLGHQDVVDNCPTKEQKQVGCFEYNANTKQPHILLILSDDQGYNDVGYQGFTKIKTPVIDSLAKTGVILDNYYVQPVCSPTRGQLFSGRHQIHTGLDKVIFPGMGAGLPLNIPTLADVLKEAGYSTNLVGKWHLGCRTWRHTPTRRGFDRFFGLLNGHADYFSHITGQSSGEKGYDLYEDEKPADVEKYLGKYSTEMFAERAVDIIKNHDSTKPLFLAMTFTAPHQPYQVPKKYMKQYGEAFGNDIKGLIYAGMISCLDEAVGNITAAFKEKGLWNDTVMIYSSDNGAVPERNGSNYPLRGFKGHLFEGGIKVPGFVHSNLLSDMVKGTISKELLHVTDWFPTLACLGQAKLNDTEHLYGYDVRNTILAGEKSPRTEILHDINFHIKSAGNALFNNTFDTRFKAALRVGDWKILTGRPGDKAEPTESTKNVTTHFCPFSCTFGNVTLCVPPPCPPPACVDPATHKPTDCCYYCPHGLNCRGPRGSIIPYEHWKIVDGKNCTCNSPGLNADCV